MTAGSSVEREPSLATLPISCSAGGLHVRHAEVCARDVCCSSFACSHVARTFLGLYDRKMGLGEFLVPVYSQAGQRWAVTLLPRWH